MRRLKDGDPLYRDVIAALLDRMSYPDHKADIVTSREVLYTFKAGGYTASLEAVRDAVATMEGVRATVASDPLEQIDPAAGKGFYIVRPWRIAGTETR